MVAGYVRLSRDDDKKNYVSIENQKIIINQFAQIRNMKVNRWYEDDGVSGYSLNRPGFSKLMEDFDNDVEVVIAKDLSRIGRHNAKVLLLLDEIKESGKRLLLVDDNYDTLEDEDDIIGIKTWYNERYVKDASKKIKRVIKARQKEGTFVSGVPFGYIRDKENKAVIHIVEEEAIYIRKIYDLYLLGFGYRKIAILLTEQSIPTPSMFLHHRAVSEGKQGKKIAATEWTDSMVANILKNDFYIGNLRLHKRERNRINGPDLRIPKENQLIFSGNHKAIITQDTFELAQEIMQKRVRTNYRGQKEKPNIFGCCLICKDCGGRLTPITRKNTNCKYYICNTYNSKGKRFCEYSHLINESDLIQDVTSYIRLCRNALGDIIKNYRLNDIDNDKQTVESISANLTSAIEAKKKELKTVISQKIKDISSKISDQEVINEAYEQLQEEILAKIHSYERQLEELETSYKQDRNQPKNLDTGLDVMNHIIDHGEINRKDIEILFEKITIDKAGNTDIELKYSLSELIKDDPRVELNQKEHTIILQIMKLFLQEGKGYTSAKYLSEELTRLGYKKSKTSVEPYIALMIDNGILQPTGDRLKPYLIIPSKKIISDMINVYIESVPDWWYARNGF